MARVLAAMSGGVDSSVAALLLRDQGREVTGATLKLFADEDLGLAGNAPGGRSCCALADIEDARETAERLGLRHQVLNFRTLFRREIIDRFAAAYARGLTPNPCIDCNRYLKFSGLWERAALEPGDFLATGHYARIYFDRHSGRWRLLKARDPAKDQSYALYGLTQEQLARTLFPLGELTKGQVRNLAASQGLVNARKPDSQDICFVRHGHYAEFLEKTLGLVSPPGDFVDRQGRALGRHRGLIRYTVGQRRGLGSFGRPLYVTGLNPADNTVRLGPAEELAVHSALATEVNLISQAALDGPLEVAAKIRYNSEAVPAVLEPHPAGVKVIFQTPTRAVAPGQAAVFYQGDLVVGGGVLAPPEA